jgi:DNA polymerase I-like protein with 3'-5' exonuclease and polymerase domains
MQEEVLSLLENHLLKKLQTLEKSKTFRSLYFTVLVSFSENSNVPTSEGKVLMETYFKTFPQLSEFFKQSGQNALKFNYVRALFGRVRF